MTKVEKVATYRLYGTGRARLEKLIQRIFAPVRLHVETEYRCGNSVMSSEWLPSPLSAIDGVGSASLIARR